MKNSLKGLQAAHTKEAIQERLDEAPKHSYLKDFVYGAVDGTVTTFAVVSGVIGAGLSPVIIVILGVSNLIADGFSMATSNFLGTKAEMRLREKARSTEKEHIRLVPEGEREEIRQIFARKGFEGEQLEHIVSVITDDRKRWVDTMLQEELGLPLMGPNAWRAACSTFIAFVLVGAIPLITFVVNIIFPDSITNPFFWSAVMTGIAFFIVGVFQSRFINLHWLLGGIETLAIGGVAATLAYAIGAMLKGLGGVL